MEKETTEEKRNEMKETGSMKLDSNNRKHNVRLLTIIGEIEGHEAVSGNTKATKYEHLLPMLAEVEDSEEIDGLLILLNTMGGDVEAGLSIAEMIASISKPTVSLVLGGSHSIGGPLAVAADYSFIVPSGTMIIHPVRSNGMFNDEREKKFNLKKKDETEESEKRTGSNYLRTEEIEANLENSRETTDQINCKRTGRP